jgi:hypothetical protein
MDVSEGEFFFCMDERQNKYFLDVAANTRGAKQCLLRGLGPTVNHSESINQLIWLAAEAEPQISAAVALGDDPH